MGACIRVLKTYHGIRCGVAVHGTGDEDEDLYLVDVGGVIFLKLQDVPELD